MCSRGDRSFAIVMTLCFALAGRPSIREFAVPSAKSGLSQVAADAESRLYFTESAANRIGRYDPARNLFTEFAIPTADSAPNGIAVGLDGWVTFAETRAAKIGRFDPARELFHEFSVSDAGDPAYVAAGPGGTII